MGLLELLFGRKSATGIELVDDVIWIDTDTKYAAVSREVDIRSQSATSVILLVAHFSDVLARATEIAGKAAGRVPVQAVLAEDLAQEIAGRLELDETRTVDLIVCERHPLRSADDQLHEFAKNLPCRCRLVHHLSLEDPLLKIFMTPMMISLIRKTMSGDESITSRMVTRRIQATQRRINELALGNSKADSAEQWMQKNFPDYLDGIGSIE